jgi:hypothetical protein
VQLGELGVVEMTLPHPESWMYGTSGGRIERGIDRIRALGEDLGREHLPRRHDDTAEPMEDAIRRPELEIRRRWRLREGRFRECEPFQRAN